MALVLYCEGTCKKQMGSLEPYIIKDNKYLCMNCDDEKPISKVGQLCPPKMLYGYHFVSLEHAQLYGWFIHMGWDYEGYLPWPTSNSFHYDTFFKYFNKIKYLISVDALTWAVRRESGSLITSLEWQLVQRPTDLDKKIEDNS